VSGDVISSAVHSLLERLERRTSLSAAFWLTVLVGLLIAALLLLGVSALVDTVAEGETQTWDQAVIAWVASHRLRPVTDVTLVATHLGDFWPTAVIVSSGFWFMVGRRRYVSALALLAAVLGGFLLNTLMKDVFQRPRPLADYNLVKPIGFSFPSGHAMISASMYLVFAYVVARSLESLAWRRAVWALVGVLIAVVALSRVYLGVHYPTDVTAGFLAGSLWATVVVTALEMARQWRGRRNPEAPPTDDASRATRPPLHE
jgi:undecaprenyl-diphosphatase